MNAPRIALVHHHMSEGGIGRVLVNLSAGLAETGCTVDLVLFRTDGPYVRQVHRNVRIVDLGTRRTLKSTLALVKYLRQSRPTALVSNIAHVNVIAALAVALARVPTRLMLAEHNHMSLNSRSEPFRSVRFAYKCAPVVYRMADHIVMVSNGIADDASRYLGIPREQLSVIHNPTMPAAILAAAAEPVNHPWFDGGGPPVVLNIGRLVEQKDHATLLRAFAMLRARRAARLLILGEGPLRGFLEDLAGSLGISSDVGFHGFADNPFAFMARSNLFVLSSRWEGFGMVLAEALACGTPVVSTDCPSGPAEILLDGRVAPLVPVGDAVALAGAMESMLDSPPDHNALLARAGDFATSHIAAQYRRLLMA